MTIRNASVPALLILLAAATLPLSCALFSGGGGNTGLPAVCQTPVPKSEIGDGDASVIIGNCRLGEATVLQSFAIAEDGETIYAIQLVPGGRILPGESAALGGAERASRGDLCITKFGAGGKILGIMYCLGFGHGVQMGVESGSGGDWLWTEICAVSDGSNGWGSRIARFRFKDGAVIQGSLSGTRTGDGGIGLKVFSPMPGIDRTTVNVDSKNGRLVMRYRRNGLFHYAIYALDAAAQGDFSPLADLPQPPELGTFQGYALSGDRLYLLDGDTKESSPGSVPGGDVYITRIRLGDPSRVERRHVAAALALSFREPEGLSLYPGAGGTELAFGFASYANPGHSGKAANLYRCGLF